VKSIWILEFSRDFGDDDNRPYEDVVGVYSTFKLSVAAVPFDLVWEPTSPEQLAFTATDSNGDGWIIYRMHINNPIQADFPTWEEEQ
jgi:hypothetical protein